MKDLKIFFSNDLKNLAGEYNRVITENPLSHPLKKEITLVQSIGMGRWLSLEMASLHGVWANFEYKYPNAFFNDLYSKNCENTDDVKVATKETLTWKIYDLLKNNAQIRAYSPLIEKYCAGGDLAAFQLAEKIADTFDQYSFSRPEMISKWKSGKAVAQAIPSTSDSDSKIKTSKKADWLPLPEDQMWQYQIWKELFSENYIDRSEIRNRLLGTLEQRKNPEVPERISIFGVSTLPLYHIEILSKLAKHSDIYFYLLNPCKQYWEDLKSTKEKSKKDIQYLYRNIDPEEMHDEEGNRLLTSLGKLGQHFQKVLFSSFLDSHSNAFEENFSDKAPQNILQHIQNDILKNINRGRADFEEKKPQIKMYDRSLQIHNCHSIQREVEVLHNNLLDILNNNEDIAPRDILVMTSDIEMYAPYIESIFGVTEKGLEIPYSIADLNLKKTYETSETFLNIFAIAEKRFAASEVFGILQHEWVQKKFLLDENDINSLTGYTAGSGISWGKDEDFREKTTGVKFDEGSWRFGLDRLLAGFAAHSSPEGIFSNTVPYDGFEGSSSKAVGSFIDFIKLLIYVGEKCEQERTAEEWFEFLNEIIDLFFYENTDSSNQLSEFRKSFDSMRKSVNDAGYKGPISHEVITFFLNKHLSEERVSFGFLDGRVTFCAMLPMRSIPFKVIAVLGMNNGTFPRTSNPPAFDLTALYPKLGDRNQKNDDRYLFLENLISAKKYLYISYIGQSIFDDSKIPPSVIVSELMNYCHHNYDSETGVEIKEIISYEEKLHSFSSKYFSRDEKFFSYSQEDYDLVENNDGALFGGCSSDQNLSEKWSIPGEIPPDLYTVSISDIVNFLKNPPKYFLRNRADIYLYEKPSESLSDTETFDFDYFEKTDFEKELIEAFSENREPFKEVYLRSGALPPLKYGKYYYEKNYTSVKSLYDRIKDFLEKYSVEEENSGIEIQLDSGKILKIIPDNNKINPAGVLVYKTNIKGKSDYNKDRFECFLRHVFTCACLPENKPFSKCISIDNTFNYKSIPPEDAQKFFKQIGELYERGLKEPLPFFPKSGFAFYKGFQRTIKKEDEKSALDSGFKSAKSVYSPLGDFSYPESDDINFKTVFGRELPPGIKDTAKTVFRPYFDFEVEEK